MPRPITFGESDGEQLARAGAISLARIRNDVSDDAKHAEQTARNVERDQRIAASQALDDEVKLWQFEKQKAMDENAKRMKIETDKQAIEANEALFKINTADPAAHEQLADWGAKYFRVLDEKTGDPRLIRQFQINQARAESRQLLQARADEIKQARIDKEAAATAKAAELKANAEATRAEVAKGGLIPSGASVGDDGKLRTTYTAPTESKTKPDTFEDFNKDLAAMVLAFGDASKVPKEKWAEFEARKTRIGTSPQGSGIKPPTTPPVTTAAPGGDMGGDDSRIKLAKQALNDPNASEAHKAAARKLLGQ